MTGPLRLSVAAGSGLFATGGFEGCFCGGFKEDNPVAEDAAKGAPAVATACLATAAAPGLDRSMAGDDAEMGTLVLRLLLEEWLVAVVPAKEVNGIIRLTHMQ